MLFAQEGKPPKAEKPRRRKRATGLKNVGEYEEGETVGPQGEQYLLASLEGDLNLKRPLNVVVIQLISHVCRPQGASLLPPVPLGAAKAGINNLNQ
jgi:hypothetical protein